MIASEEVGAIGYHGDRLEPLFDADPGPVMRHICREVAGRWVQLARANTPRDTGELREAWFETAVDRRGDVYRVRVVNPTDYGVHVEHGTGLFGPRHAKYPIKPKNPGGVLRWFDRRSGQWAFATEVMHPGSPGAHMLAISAAVTESELERIASPVIGAWIGAIGRRAS